LWKFGMKKMKRKKTEKNKLLVFVTLILISSALLGTIAYLFDSYSKSNFFELGTVKTDIIEDLDSNGSDSNKRSNISIKNTGNVAIYIRTSVLLYFENNEEEIITDEPVENTDYTLKYSASDNWILAADGYYYYKVPILANESTDILIESFESKAQYDQKKLILDIVTQAIQAEPNNAIEESWGVNVVNNEIVL